MLLSCGVALIIALAVSATVYLSMLNHGHSFVRLFAWQFGSWGFWGILSPLVFRHAADLVGGRWNRRHAIAAFGLWLALTIAHTIITAALTVVLRPFYPLASGTFTSALIGQFTSLFLMDAFVFGVLLAAGSAYSGYRRARQLDLRESRLEAELVRAQLHALQLEIQPHFLFNTLNSISALIRLKDDDGALKMLLGLSDLMRTALEQPKNQLVTLAAEIEFVKRYIDLQRARFADRLQVQYQIGEGCDAIAVPTFLLQPLVENALRHGAAPRPGPCQVRIGARNENGRLRLWVADDGVGLPRGFNVDRDSGTGLRNTRSRLAQLYGTAATFDVRTDDAAGTIVEIAVPFVPVNRAVATT